MFKGQMSSIMHPINPGDLWWRQWSIAPKTTYNAQYIFIVAVDNNDYNTHCYVMMLDTVVTRPIITWLSQNTILNLFEKVKI